MNSVKTITIDNQMRPVALSRSSIKVSKDTSQEFRLRSSSTTTLSEPAHHYSNLEARRDNKQATKINIRTSSHVQDAQLKHIDLVIDEGNNNHPSNNATNKEQDSYLTTLIDEYQACLNRKDCDNPNCYRFKLLSYRISQTLFERINFLKNELQVTKGNSANITKVSLQQQPSIDNDQKVLNTRDTATMDDDKLLNIVLEKNKRIQDLEKQVDDQRRLRLQDASQVEEKAARIKEWVANKLKELENQNKQLRDQNRKQKEAVDSLSTKLAMLSPLSSPRHIKGVSGGSIHFIDQSSPVEKVDIDKSLKTRRPQIKNAFHAISSTSEDDTLRVRIGSGQQNFTMGQGTIAFDKPNLTSIVSVSQDLSSKGTPLKLSNSFEQKRQESPVYDSVTIDHSSRKVEIPLHGQYGNGDTHYDKSNGDCVPPPPPLHRSDRWELELYNLADQTLSSMKKCQSEDGCNDSCIQPCSIESNSEKEVSTSRKSSSSLKNDLISLVKPSFTTIDGDHVVDSLEFNTDTQDAPIEQTHVLDTGYRNSDFMSSQPVQAISVRKDSIDSCESFNEKNPAPTLFDSPMRSRVGKDSILRTQSVRRNPAPEKLFSFISADLIKRGYLVKPGALKNHNRWFVLKNFQLLSYKSESEETLKATPCMKLKLEPSCQVYSVSHSGESSFPFKLCYPDKTLQLIADTAQVRDEWIKILTVTINMSDIDPDSLTKSNCTFEGIMKVTRHGHTKRYNANLVNHVIFFLRSVTDPTPISYLSVKGSKIREVTDSYDHDFEEQESTRQKSCFQDCSLAIYPKYSTNLDPVYITVGEQQETDKWFHYLSLASGIDQSYGTQFERNLTKLMISNSMGTKPIMSGNSDYASGCLWKEHSVMLYSDRPITQPLTTLPNETLHQEATELFKSILLFTQVPLEPVAIDYHNSLLQNCLGRFLKYPELRNEFYAQLIKQCTYVIHRCSSPKLSSSSSGCSSINQRSSVNSLSPSSSECQFITDVQLLDSMINERSVRLDTACSTLSQLNSLKDRTGLGQPEDMVPPSQSELLQVMQILAVAVSLNLPRGRLRWWLIDHLRKFANPETNIGKYALYTLRAIDRTVKNGTRDYVPSRTEIMGILLRNPYDHSNPHSLPVNFSDGSYLVVEADGSTTVDEFLSSVTKKIDIRPSLISDFYLFADDPSGARDLHILEPQRKVLDIVGWWEQSFRRNNSGRYQNTKTIRLTCKKRLVLKMEDGETFQERLLIVHQLNQELVAQTVTLRESLVSELTAIIAQLTFGDLDKSCDLKLIKRKLEKISSRDHNDNDDSMNQLVERWQHLAGRSTQDCVRVYLNCIRRLKLDE